VTGHDLDDITASLSLATRHLADARIGEEMTRVARAQMSDVLRELVALYGRGPFDFGGLEVRVVEKDGRYHMWRSGRRALNR
jgi:hypothetical protein